MSKNLNVTATMTVQAAFIDEIGINNLPTLTGSISTTNGTGANQADSYYQGQRTVASSGSADTIDLNGGTTLYGYGPNGSNTLLSFVKITQLVIVNPSATATLTVGGGTNGVVSWAVPIPPGGTLAIGTGAAVGIPVTPATGDILKVATDTGTNVVYNIGIAGRSA